MSRISDALIVHYKLNDSLATDVIIDETGNHNGVVRDAGGTATSAFHSVAGKINKAQDFDGTDDYIEIANHADFNFVLVPFSIAIWIKGDAVSGKSLMTKYDGAGNDEFILNLSAAGGAYFRCYDDSSGGRIGRASDGTPLSADIWQNLVITCDGGKLSSGIKIYLSGGQIDDADSKTGTFDGIEALNADVKIGTGYGSLYDGLIDNVMIFNKELSADEVKRLYNNGHGTEILADLDQSRLPRRGSSPFGLRARYEN